MVKAVATAALLWGAGNLLVMSHVEAQTAGEVQEKLAALRQERRVLLVLAPDKGDPAYQTQVKLWADQQSGFTERDLVELPVFAGPKDREALAKRYGAQPGPFAVVLIGKDGHAAFSTDRPVSAQEIFEKIDAMPMRREEMRQRRRPASAQ